MEKFNAIEMAEKKFDEVIKSGGKYNNPDASLLNDYIFWLGEVADESGGTIEFSNFCVKIMDKIYNEKLHNNYHWMNKVEMVTVLSLKIADNQQQEIE